MVQQLQQLPNPPRLVLIATYPQMSKLFMRLVAEQGLQAASVFAAFEDAVAYARAHESEVDAILSRGGTADYIRRSVSVPVIFIPIMPFDVARAVHGLAPEIREVAFIHFKEKVRNVQDVAHMAGVSIREYTFLNREDIHKAVEDARKSGVNTIVGGEVAVAYAHSLGMRGIEVGAGEYSVSHALQETIQVLVEKEKEKRHAAQLKAAFSSLSEGLVVTDEESRLVICNPAAEKLLGRHLPLGQPAQTPLRDEQYEASLKEKAVEKSYLKKSGDTFITASHRPIFAGENFLGVVSTLQDVTKIQKLEKQIRHEMYTKGFTARYTFDDIISRDPTMIALKNICALVAKTESAILIEGESGTGKELFAQSIHNASQRTSGPFVAVNCAAIPENLMESELFGYESGAFTGAKKEGKPGLFELAHNGTIFLDEIGELSMPMQTRLLRVLQEKEVMRIGGNRIIPIDVRVISATNQNLPSKIRENGFRQDLYYRLNVLSLHLPALRERPEDILPLARLFLERYSTEISDARWKKYMPFLKTYAWPGNIRELQNLMERLAMLMQMPEESVDALEKVLFYGLMGGAPAGAAPPPPEPPPAEAYAETEDGSLKVTVAYQEGLRKVVAQVEKQVIDHLLTQYGGDQEKVAELLKIGKTTLWRKEKGLEQ